MSLICPVCTLDCPIDSKLILWVVCSSCQHLLQVDAEQLIDCGEAPKVPDVDAPFKLGDTGRIRGRSFCVIGRIHCRYLNDPDAYWDEWYISYQDKSTGYILIEEDGYALYADTKHILTNALPQFDEVTIGDIVYVGGHEAKVYEKESILLLALAGQLPNTASPGSIRHYYDAMMRNYIVSVEDEGDGVQIHYGIEIDASDIELD